MKRIIAVAVLAAAVTSLIGAPVAAAPGSIQVHGKVTRSFDGDGGQTVTFEKWLHCGRTDVSRGEDPLRLACEAIDKAHGDLTKVDSEGPWACDKSYHLNTVTFEGMINHRYTRFTNSFANDCLFDNLASPLWKI